MLKTQPKIWAIVIVVCLIGQFFISGIPMIKESWDQRVAEQEAADRLAANNKEESKPTEIAKENESENQENVQPITDSEDHMSEDEEESDISLMSLLLVVFTLAGPFLGLIMLFSRD